MIKFLHCADLHLDSPLAALDMRRAQVRRNEFRAAFTSLTLYVKMNKIDFLLISGDLLESTYATKDTVALLKREFAAIPDCEIIIQPGNHDPYTPQCFYRRAEFTPNVHIFDTDDLSCFDFPEKNTSIYGYAFTATELDRCPFIGTHPTDKSRINILMAHGEIGKSVSIKCPIPNEAISETGYDYVALGHYHDFSGIKQLGSSYYAYCGCLEGRGFDERGDKGAIIGIAEKELETGKFNLGAKFIRFSKRRYESEKLDISGCRTNADVVGRLAALISEKKYGEDTALRVKLTGSVAGELRISEEFISAQFPQLFLLRLNDETLPLLDADQLSRDPTIRGAFYETLRPMLESADENERELAASALRYGLAAISGGDIADF